MKVLIRTLITVWVFSLSCPLATAAQPNILFISIDDLRPQLGCYGDHHVKSPHIDRLAASGVTFENCYVQVAVCNPSRASMLTGLRPNTLKCWTLPYHFRETKPDTVTMPQYLRQQGYHAEAHGKIFHNPWQDPRSWSVPHRFGEGSYTHYTKEQLAFVEATRESLPKDAGLRKFLRGPITNDPEVPDAKHPDGEMARTVCQRLGHLKTTGQPFFLAIGFILPHLPWCPPKKYWDLYDPKTIALAANDRPISGVPDTEMGTNYELSHYADSIDFPTPTGGKVSEAKARHLIHGYLASVSFIDAQVGLVLAALEQQGLADNTIVVLWSDHGYKLGEHNGWGKMTNLEIDCRIPLIIRDPRAKANGKRCTRLVESIDLFPTLCERSRVPVPGWLEGRSMAPLLDDPGTRHDDAAFSQYVYAPLMGNSLRTPEWRYTEWFDMESGAIRHRILYDHRSDHSENQNVIGGHPAIADQLQKQLHAVLPNQTTRLLPPVHSSTGGEKTAVTFVNRHPGTVRLTWVPPNGCRTDGQDIAPGKSQRSTTTVGHVFVAESLDGKYHEIITIQPGREELILGSDN